MTDGVFAQKVLVTLSVVDVVASARSLGMTTDHRGQPLPEHDYRFVLDTPPGGEVMFNRYATAEQVATYCEREGWLPS